MSDGRSGLFRGEPETPTLYQAVHRRITASSAAIDVMSLPRHNNSPSIYWYPEISLSYTQMAILELRRVVAFRLLDGVREHPTLWERYEKGVVPLPDSCRFPHSDNTPQAHLCKSRPPASNDQAISPYNNSPKTSFRPNLVFNLNASGCGLPSGQMTWKQTVDIFFDMEVRDIRATIHDTRRRSPWV